MSLLSRVVNLAFNVISLPFLENNVIGEVLKSDIIFFPLDVIGSIGEPCKTLFYKFRENELKLTALARGFCPNCCPVNIHRDIRFVAYSRKFSSGVPIQQMRSGYAEKAGIDKNLPTVIFIHGFSESSPGHSGRTVIDAYFTRPEPRNLILLDWSELSTFPWYQTAVLNVKHAAQRLKRFIEVFHDSGEIPIRTLHVIGFSLGSHVAGIGGKLLRHGLQIPHITGLDPALPEYSLTDSSERLSKESAEYVDIIHTDAGIFGIPIAIGHADFFPNGGRALQPGCQPSYIVKQGIVNQVLACSHIRSWKLYSESVVNPRAFPASRCTLWRGPNKHCEFTVDAYMGFPNTNTTFGSFYLITNGEKPYGKTH
uniref:Pancreatic triacylglycerol lipase isoform X1 n=1 Tax=Diabrotica virgifera virgifera TaxID=50390 RepID=A0A6P7FU19_DIAVI